MAFPDQTLETCVGRILLFEILPESFGFVNEQLDKSKIKKLVALSLERFGQEKTVEFIDKLKVLGFEQATSSGLSWSMSDLDVPAEKENLLRQSEKQIEEVRAVPKRVPHRIGKKKSDNSDLEQLPR